MSSKKGKKVKGKTLPLTDFLASGIGVPEAGKAIVVAPKKYSSWADESDDIHQSDGPDTYKTETFVLPTAPRSAMGPDIDPRKIPTKPPYTAFIANLPYDVDMSDIEKFFRQFTIVNIRLPKEGDNGRLKGFGYVEFPDASSLLEALTLNDTTIKNRNIRVDLAGNEGEQGSRDGSRRNQHNDKDDRTNTDWRAARKENFGEGEDFRNDRYGSRDQDRDRYDRGGYRGNKYSNRGFDGDDDDRRRNYRSNDRGYDRGGRYDSYGDRGGRGESYMDRGNRYDHGDRGNRYEPPGKGRRYDDSDRDYNRGNSFDRNRGYRRDDRDRLDDRSSHEDRGPRNMRRESEGDRESMHDEPPRERKKLVLLPKSTSNDRKKEEKADVSGSSGGGGGGSSIFGGAKPVDTAAREREIERRLAREREEKLKEEESKAQNSSQYREPEMKPSYKEDSSMQPASDSRTYKDREKDANKENRPRYNDDREPVSRKYSSGRRSDDENKGNQLSSREKVKPNRSRCRSDRSDKSSDLDDVDKHSKPVQAEEYKPPNYASENKFAGLSLEDNDLEADSDAE